MYESVPSHHEHTHTHTHTQPEDWYSVTLEDLKQLGFSRTISKPQLAEFLSEKYPNYKFEKVYLLKGRYAQQKRLENAVVALLPVRCGYPQAGGRSLIICCKGIEIITNARKEHGLINPDTSEFFELDIYVPALRIAFEYQVHGTLHAPPFSIDCSSFRNNTIMRRHALCPNP